MLNNHAGKIKKYSSFLLNSSSLDLIFLGVLFFIAFLLRVYLLDDNLFFGPEQGRDLLAVKAMVVDHKIPLIGPKTAIDGIFHGPIYYYLMAIPFFLTKGDPFIINLFLVFVNTLTVFLIYLLGKEIINRKVGLTASIIFTFSFGSIVFSRWLSHPPLSIPLACLFFLSLIRFLKGHKIYLLWLAVFFSLVGQVEFINFIYFTPILLFILIYFRKQFFKPQNKYYLLFSLFALIFFSTINYLIFDLRHQFLIINNVVKMFSGHVGYSSSFLNAFSSTLETFLNFFSDTVIPLPGKMGSILLIIGVILLFLLLKKNKLPRSRADEVFSKREKFVSLRQLADRNKIGLSIILIWLLIPFVTFIVIRYSALYHYFASSVPVMILLVSWMVILVWDKRKILGFTFLFLLIVLNFMIWIKNIPENKNIFFQTTQPSLKYSDQKSVIDKIYEISNGKNFSFQSYTIPYWLQDAWDYLFWYYGKGKFGYEPIKMNQKTLFVIIQDDPSNVGFQENWHRGTVSKWGRLENTFRFGALEVEQLKVE